MRERVKLKLSLLYCTVESVESVLGSVEPTFKPTSRRRAYSCTSRHRAYGPGHTNPRYPTRPKDIHVEKLDRR